MMKKGLLAILLVMCASWIPALAETPASADKESLDKIVAIVNEDVVTKSELEQNLQIARAQFAQQTGTEPVEKTLRKQVLDQMINKKIQLQIAKQAGINIKEADVDKAIAYIAQQNNMSVTELYDRVEQDGVARTKYRAEMREQIMLQKMQEQAISNQHFNVTPQEITAFLRTSSPPPSGIKEYKVQDILIPLSDEAKPEEIAAAEQQAKNILAKLEKHQDISTESNVESSDLGWRKLAEFPSLFTDKIAALKPNEISSPIQAGNGFHLLQLTEERIAGASVQASPSRKQAEQMLLQRKYAEAVQTFIAKQRSQAFIKTLDA